MKKQLIKQETKKEGKIMKKQLSIILLVAVSFVLSLSLITSAQSYECTSTAGTGVLFGRVVDENGDGIEGVTIRTCAGGGSSSGAGGIWSFQTSAGSIRVEASKSGYRSSSAYVDLYTGSVENIDFVLHDGSGTGGSTNMFDYFDFDFDGIINLNDNCVWINNPSQTDNDNDDIGDACDFFLNDTDNDGLDNNSDNCVDVCNVDQRDADNDDIGDVCDNDPGCGGCGEPACGWVWCW
jgi:hypothetical protein